MDESRLFEIFQEIQSGIPRHLGSNKRTLKVLSYFSELPQNPDILDIGCGPAMQTICLAQALNCYITAIDTKEEYLNKLIECAKEAKLSDRTTILNQDMNELYLKKEGFDLIWAKGSAYIM